MMWILLRNLLHRLWKNSVLIWLSLTVFSAGLAYSMYLSAQTAKKALAAVRRDNHLLQAQLADERQSWQHYERRLEALQSAGAARNKRLLEQAAQSRQQSRQQSQWQNQQTAADAPVAPILSHALGELRQAQEGNR